MSRLQCCVGVRGSLSEDAALRDGSWEERNVLRSRAEASDLVRVQVTLPIGFAIISVDCYHCP